MKDIGTVKYKFDLEYDPIGPVELNGIKYVPADYLERLEAAYLELKTCDVWDETYTCIARDNANDHLRRANEKARESLERIKRGEQG